MMRRHFPICPELFARRSVDVVNPSRLELFATIKVWKSLFSVNVLTLAVS